MMKDIKLSRRYLDKNLNEDEVENVPLNPSDSLPPQIGTDPSRPPLNSIQEHFQISIINSDHDLSGVKVKSKVDRTPNKQKPKYSDTSTYLRTPEKPGLLSKNRFGWPFRAELQTSSAVVESKEEGKMVSNTNTPRSTRTGARANLSFSECNSTQSTPTKSVSKPPNPVVSLANGSRPQSYGSSRTANFSGKGISNFSNSTNALCTAEVPSFDLKEDPSFWMEHNVQVLIRVRPLNSMEVSGCGFDRCLKQESAQCLSWVGQPESRFTFDHVACESVDQETLFRVVGLPMVENCLSGYNSCIFAYGQTGSGKTYTMLGGTEELEIMHSPNRGMTPRVFEFLFARIRAEEESRKDERLKYNCKCSFLEIYNEQITDLLDPSSSNLMLREDMKTGVYVENLSEFEVVTVADILQLLSQGSSNRKVAATNMNSESSRSHSVFTCVIESRWEKDSATNFRFARLNLVDLAGSERQKSSGAEGKRLKEAASINKSLSTLGHVIMVLVDIAHGKPRHVPYRDSRLTFLLQDSLGGNSKTMIIANVSPSICCAAETLNTLKFAQRAKLIQNNAIVNEDSAGDVRLLQYQIKLLKEELAVLKREKVSRSLLFEPTVDRDTENKDEDDYNHWTLGQEHPSHIVGDESNGFLRVSCNQLKSMEITLAGALRREQMAETSNEQLEAEIDQLNRLVSQREEDTRCTKMMLKFREDKIQRMESFLDGLMSADDYLIKENAALSEEIQLLRAKLNNNPEVTRFARENIRLLEEVRRFQDLYEAGEREQLMSEISNLRKQFFLFIDGNSDVECHDAEVNHESGSLNKQLMRSLSELEESKRKLNCCLENNTKLRGEINELQASLNALRSETQEQDNSAEVIKESIVEIPAFNNQPVAVTQEEKEEATNRDLSSHGEGIMDLELDLDILKSIVQEERLHRNEAEEMNKSLNRELQSHKEMIESLTNEYENYQEEISKAKLVIEALESQQILSINELEDLRISNSCYDKRLREKELEISSLKDHAQVLEFRNMPSNRDHSLLEAKLKKMHGSLDKARRLNQLYQSDRVFQSTNDEEMEEARKQVEAETAEVIVCLQEELSLLQLEVQNSNMKEMEMTERLVMLQIEKKNLEDSLDLKGKDNTNLSEMLENREAELRNLTEELELVTNEIEGILSRGQESVDDESHHTNIISSSIHGNGNQLFEQFGKLKYFVNEKDALIEELNQCLRNGVDRRNELECKLNALRGAAVLITEAHQQECSEKDNDILLLTSELRAKTAKITELENLIKHEKDALRDSSSCATVAFVIVNRLHEMNLNYEESLRDKELCRMEFQETITKKDGILNNQASLIQEANKQNHCLQMELDASEENRAKLKLQLLEEGKLLKDLQVKREEAEERKILETMEELKELNSEVSSLKFYLDEYVSKREDPLKHSYPGSSFGFLACDGSQPSTSTRTEQEINQIEPCDHAANATIETSKCSFNVSPAECITGHNKYSSTSILRDLNSSRDDAIVVLRKEIEFAVKSLREMKAEMIKLQHEKEEISESEKQNRKSIESLMNQAVLLQNSVDNFEGEIEFSFFALKDKLVRIEEIMQDSSKSWFEQRELLEAELDDAKVTSAQKAIEASCVIEKFEEVQDTMKEADIMINELMIVNEALKLNVHELKVKEKCLTNQRDLLVSEIQNLKMSSNLENQRYEKFEKMHETDLIIVKRMLMELEDVIRQVQTNSMEEWMTLTSDFLHVKSQVLESTKLIRSLLEEVWSEIIVKDCAVSVLHLCHMGILLETANGLNVENSFLHHGLCESNSIISELREQNSRSRKELELCRILRKKLLADIKKGFDRMSSKSDESEDLTLKLTSFEKKLQGLQFQEELMLKKSNDMGFELSLLTRELDLNNRQTLESILNQERTLKEKDESFECLEESFMFELLTRDFEMIILSSEFKQMAALNAGRENMNRSVLEVFENFKTIVFLYSLNAASCESMLLDEKTENSFLETEVSKANMKLEKLLLALEKERSISTQMEASNKALEKDIWSLKEVAISNDSLKCSFNEMMESERILTCKCQELESHCDNLLQDVKMKETIIQTTSRRISVLDQENEKLHKDICLLETKSYELQMELATKAGELQNASCLGRENQILQDQLKDQKERCSEILQLLEDKNAEFESSVGNSNVLAAENHKLRNNISLLEDSVAKLKEEMQCTVLSMNSSQIDGLTKYANEFSCRIQNLITQKFADLDDRFTDILAQVEKADKFMEKIEHVEHLTMLLDSEILSLHLETSRKDDILKGLLFDLSLLQESASNSIDQKGELEELQNSFSALEKDFELKLFELKDVVAEGQILKEKLQEKTDIISVLKQNFTKEHEIVVSLTSQNDKLLADIRNALHDKDFMEKKLSEARIKSASLELEVTDMQIGLAEMIKETELLTKNLDASISERDDMEVRILALTKDIEMERALAEENGAIAREAQEIAESQKIRAEEKKEEVKLLERSIEELESTIDVLEKKVDIVKEESERQQLQREELELELYAVKEQMLAFKANDSDIKRHLDEKEKNLQEAFQRLNILEREIADRDAKISQCNAHICELNLHAEAQACEYKQKFKALEAMVEQVKTEVPSTHGANSSSNKQEKIASKSRGSGSPFKCIGLGLAQQIKSETNEELSAGRQRIEELEALASSRQKEIFLLKARLASTESMTHDVIRDLLGVKLNMNSCATLMDNKQLHSLLDEAQHHNVEVQFKEQEVADLKRQINEFIKERNGWLEEIERKQAEMVAAHVGLEKLRQQDQLLTTENEMLKIDNAHHRKRVMELEGELKKLSGQQNIHQRIHHHAKIKEENNLLKCQNEDISMKLHRTESILSRVKEELAQFRSANGRSPYINFDEEQLLDKKLKETEEERLHLAQKLLGLCTAVLKAAGITKPTSDISLPVAEEALEQLKTRVISLEMELQDVKLKNRISNERVKLSELKSHTSTINSRTGENSQSRNSPSQIFPGWDR